ncbi:BamA/TamA family outer membrane protein [Reichenbachiella agariperforans]|uniref:BamA/TamA family outer membrane protein n=1 Tax=Reichenbachiella agariperforans TaxID=156994 RepID=UPI001C09F4B8|nr:BamA/TamA family outer membrane protein [Reichenbachiella agariperforans]MBU2912952.1 outer membrane protein assembly factor [Reichenbachiella agariperforans]
MILLVLLSFSLVAQDTTATKEDKKAAKEAKKNKVPEKGDVYFSPVPVLGANPAFGFIYGAGAAVSSFLGEPSDTKLSSALLGLAFTTKKQTIVTLKSTVFTSSNDWVFMGDWRYLDSSQPTYGIGTGPQSARLADDGFEFDDKSYDGTSEVDMMEFNFFRFYETALRKVNDNGFYAGVGLHLDLFNNINDQLLRLAPGDTVITPYYAYNVSKGFDQDKSTLVGLSLNGMLDTRDNINNPYAGRYALISFKMNPAFIGSDQNSTSLWLEYRDYFNFTDDNNNILAVWAFGNFTTSGNLPYMNLPASAWDQYSKSSEPYAQGRFRGYDLVFAGLEFRKHLIATKKNPKFFGAVAYANMTTASGGENGIDLFEYIEPGYGLGLRFNISQKSRTNIGIDYGWGNYGTSGLFLRLNENF